MRKNTSLFPGANKQINFVYYAYNSFMRLMYHCSIPGKPFKGCNNPKLGYRLKMPGSSFARNESGNSIP